MGTYVSIAGLNNQDLSPKVKSGYEFAESVAYLAPNSTICDVAGRAMIVLCPVDSRNIRLDTMACSGMV